MIIPNQLRRINKTIKLPQNSYKFFSGPKISLTIKENHISSSGSMILRYKHTDRYLVTFMYTSGYAPRGL